TLRTPDPRHLSKADSATHVPADVVAEYQARPDHAAQHLLEGRRARRLQACVLEIRAAPAGARGDRISHQLDPGCPSPYYVRALGLTRQNQRLLLFAEVAGSLRSRG